MCLDDSQVWKRACFFFFFSFFCKTKAEVEWKLKITSLLGENIRWSENAQPLKKKKLRGLNWGFLALPT